MKLRTRLIVSFCIIIFVPVLLMGIALWGFGQFQMKAIRRAYDVEGTSPYEYLTNSIRVISRFTKTDYESLLAVAEETPEKLEDKDYLAQINEDLARKFSYLVVKKGANLIYTGDQKVPEGIRE